MASLVDAAEVRRWKDMLQIIGVFLLPLLEEKEQNCTVPSVTGD